MEIGKANLPRNRKKNVIIEYNLKTIVVSSVIQVRIDQGLAVKIRCPVRS